ncbi:MAG: pyrimidine utilization protein C [Actinobacteria bacterium]|nr:pyrimidine utilization protein C [Actinomycetota bacterium]
MPEARVKRFNGNGLAAPKVPLSHGALVDGWLHVAGMVARDKSGQIVDDDAKQATIICLENLMDVVSTAGGTKSDVVKVNVYLKDFGDYPAMNAAFEEFFGGDYPTRTTIESGLGLGDVELDGVAFIADPVVP